MIETIKAWFTEGNFIDLLLPFTIDLMIALAIYVVGNWLVKRIVAVFDKLMAVRNFDEALTSFLHAIVYTVLRFVVLIVVLEQLGVDTTSLLALLGAAGLAVGLALKDSLSNFASGVMLILNRPFSTGNFVEAAGIAGVVEKITVFNTVLVTGDNKEIIVPNSQIYGGTITNYSARDTRRVDITMGIGYDDDIRLARSLMKAIIDADERIHKDKEPVLAVGELADSSVNFVVRVWVNTADYWAVKWDLIESFKRTFDENGVSIPYPQRDVHVHQVK